MVMAMAMMKKLFRADIGPPQALMETFAFAVNMNGKMRPKQVSLSDLLKRERMNSGKFHKKLEKEKI